MDNQDNNFYCFLLFLFILTPFSYATASGNSALIEYSLSLSNQDTHFDFKSDGVSKVRVNQLGINWYEPFSKYFHAGLEVGYINLSQADNPLSSAQFSSGEYAGLLLRFLPLETPSFSVTLNLNYRYNKTQGNSTSQETQIVWDETLLSSEIHFQPVDQIGLFLAAEYLILHGEQRDSGNITQVINFNSSKQQGYRFGLNFIVNHTGVIGIERVTGFRSGTRLYFSRKF